MRRTRTRGAFALAFVTWAGVSATALGSVFVNGVNVDGAILNQKLERCTVTFDGKGNVLIDAPGYAIQALQPPPAAEAPPTPTTAQPGVLTKKYFVVSEQSMQGMTQYDIDLYINSKWVRKFRSDDDQVVTEVTQFIHPGPNKILFMAKKNIVGARKAFTPAATYMVTLGEGDANGDKVVIDNPLLTYKRSADQTDDASQEYTVNGR
ncbi:MAG TPA: hypothetical protein VMB50_24320 [Myxococcales bacterium]|nr:hypothetical protein [Myxococcales bacterium]